MTTIDDDDARRLVDTKRVVVLPRLRSSGVAHAFAAAPSLDDVAKYSVDQLFTLFTPARIPDLEDVGLELRALSESPSIFRFATMDASELLASSSIDGVLRMKGESEALYVDFDRCSEGHFATASRVFTFAMSNHGPALAIYETNGLTFALTSTATHAPAWAKADAPPGLWSRFVSLAVAARFARSERTRFARAWARGTSASMKAFLEGQLNAAIDQLLRDIEALETWSLESEAGDADSPTDIRRLATRRDDIEASLALFAEMGTLSSELTDTLRALDRSGRRVATIGVALTDEDVGERLARLRTLEPDAWWSLRGWEGVA